MYMKKTILTSIPIFAVVLSSCFLVSCGGGSGTSKANTTNNSTGGSNSNSSSSSSSVQINQGQVAVYNSEVTSINDVSVLNINTVFVTGDKSQIDSLQMCNEKKCWTLIDSKSKNSKKLSHKFTAKKLTENKSSQKLGSFAIPEDGVVVDRLKYIYKGKKGEIKLDDPINLNKSSARDIHLSAGENLSIGINSLSMMGEENILYLTKEELEHEFNNGVIVKVPKGATKNNSLLTVYKISDEKSYINSYSVVFADIDEIDKKHGVAINKTEKTLKKEISVLIPVNDIKNSDSKKRLYAENGNEEFILDYEVTTINGKEYIKFLTNRNEISINFREDLSLPRW